MGDRINKISIGKFDQVVALTQQTINAGLQAQYDYAIEQGFGTARDVTLGSKYGYQGFYQAIFSASRVIINYSVGNKSSCLFRVSLQSGQFKVYTSDADGDNSITSYDMKGMFFAFPCDIGLSEVAKDSALYEEKRNLMNKPGDYTIKQLLVDFDTAKTGLLNETETSFGVWNANDWILKDLDVPTPRAGAQPTPNNWRPEGWVLGAKRVLNGVEKENLSQCISRALKNSLISAAAGQLGFIVSATDLNKIAQEPTFVPTDVRFQTYPYVDPKGQTIASIDGNGRLNYLLYLEMTNSASPPIGKEEFLETYNGNWTNGTNPKQDGFEEFGTYVLSKQKFFETWFVPKLKKLNRMMSAQFGTIKMDFTVPSSWNTRFNFPLTVGSGTQAYNIQDVVDDQYLMSFKDSQPEQVNVRVNAAGNVGLWPDLSAGAMTWYQWKTPSDWSQNDIVDKYKCESTALSVSCSRFSILPGSNKMTLEGFTALKFGFTVRPPKDDKHEDINDMVMTWKIVFTLTEVTDGGLAVLIDDPIINYTWRNEVTHWTSGGANFGVSGDIDGHFDTAKNNLHNLVHEFKNALEGNERFYFPSRGRFFFKDPLVGHTGDLVVKCGYNGTEDIDQPANPEATIPRDTSIASNFAAINELKFGNA